MCVSATGFSKVAFIWTLNRLFFFFLTLHALTHHSLHQAVLMYKIQKQLRGKPAVVSLAVNSPEKQWLLLPHGDIFDPQTP